MNRKRITARRVGWIVLGVLALLIGILIWNTLTFSSRQLKATPVSLLKLDSVPILERFVQGIRISTVSTPMSRIANDSELYRFRDYIQESFPNLHTLPFVRRTGKDFGDERNPSILFQWPGQEPERVQPD